MIINSQEHSFRGVSESESEDDTSPDSSEGEHECDDEESAVHWSEEDLQGLMQDLNEPIPEPALKQPMSNQVNILLQWFCCFILYWQILTHISDAAVQWILLFLGRFLQTLGYGLDSELFSNFVLVFPTTIYMLQRIANLKRDDFEKFVVCSKCATLYQLDECLERKHGTVIPKQCSNILFPLGKARHCNTKLVNKVILKNGITKFYPLKVYCWKSIISQLERILQREGFPDLCEHWRSRQVEESVLSDMYDGDIWKNFKWHDGTHFFDQERHYGLILNVDWFQPFKRRSDYSVGVIYFALVNLPRSERFKFENIFLGGIIPSLDSEPKLHTFLDPCVDELNALWKGVMISTSLTPVPLKAFAALLCVAADIPATRKVSGFVGHSANRACSKCFKYFAGGFGEKKDFSGFQNRASWPKRDKVSHKRNCEKLQNCKSQSEYNRKSREFGVHYSSLCKLEYFNCVRFHVIDPMHNLFLGTAKYVFKLWAENLFSKEQLKELSQKIKELNTATSIGRIPRKIGTNYGSYTAEEWKNWTVTFSMYALHGILPDNHLRIWERFVMACRILCQPVISKEEIMKSDALLVNFCTGMETLYGKKGLTCNMHLHCHLSSVLFDYGPVFGFWLFSFERYNGQIGATRTNNRSVEIQFMRDFVKERFLMPSAGNLPSIYEEDFLPLFSQLKSKRKTTLRESCMQHNYFLSQVTNFANVLWHDNANVTAPASFEMDMLTSEDITTILIVYQTLYPGRIIDISDLHFSIKKFSSIFVGAEKFGSRAESRTSRSARVLASWNDDDGNISSTSALSPGIINYFFVHQVTMDGIDREHYFAHVRWFKQHPIYKRLGNFTTLDVWDSRNFESGIPSCYLPVHRIHSLFTGANFSLENVSLIAVCPIPRRAAILQTN